MRNFLFFSVFYVIFFSVNGQDHKIFLQEIPEEYGYVVKPGDQAPEMEFFLTDGTKITNAGFAGKVVMLQFTASWCSVCRKEMPHIENEIWQKHKNRGDFLLYGLDLDEPVETVRKFAEDVKITYPLAPDPKGKVFYSFAEKGAGVTRNVILDKTGKIVFMTRLFREDEFEQMKKVIDRLLED